MSIMSATGEGELYVKVWECEGAPKAAVQIVHGMAEHIERYDRFAKALTARGMLVVGHDQAGHGKSIRKDGIRGYFGAENGWSNLIQDVKQMRDYMAQKAPGVPLVLFGHSMGSFISRSYAARHGGDHDIYIFSGTAGKNGALPIAKLIAKSQIKKNDGKAESELLNSLSFGAYNKPFKPNRTEFDWLSRDSDEVDKYVNDEFCGFCFTAKAFGDLFDGLCELDAPSWPGDVPNKPILLISGKCDPVGGKAAKGVLEVADRLKSTGHDVTVKLYEGARHELLNELNKEEVTEDIISFIEENIK